MRVPKYIRRYVQDYVRRFFLREEIDSCLCRLIDRIRNIEDKIDTNLEDRILILKVDHDFLRKQFNELQGTADVLTAIFEQMKKERGI